MSLSTCSLRLRRVFAGARAAGTLSFFDVWTPFAPRPNERWPALPDYIHPPSTNVSFILRFEMPIVWTRLGFLVPVVFMASLCAGQLVVDSIFGEGYYSSSRRAILVVSVLTGLVLFFVGLWLNWNVRRQPWWGASERENLARYHTFMFIPFQHWAYPAVFLGFFASAVPVERDHRDSETEQPPAVEAYPARE